MVFTKEVVVSDHPRNMIQSMGTGVSFQFGRVSGGARRELLII